MSRERIIIIDDGCRDVDWAQLLELCPPVPDSCVARTPWRDEDIGVALGITERTP